MMYRVPDEVFNRFPGIQERFNKNMCLLVFSYDRHLPFLHHTLTSMRKFGLYTVLAWDRPLRVHDGLMGLVDALAVKHQTVSGVVLSWFWHTWNTIHYADYFDYIFSVSGDCYFDTPHRLPELMNMMGDKDIITYWHDKNRIGTMGWICKSDAYKKIFRRICDKWNDPNRPGHMAEGRVMQAVKDLNLTYANTMQKYFEFKLPPDGDPDDKRGRGVFGEILGMRHLHWEHHRREAAGMTSLKKLGLMD